jgi:hypothetical protein
MRPPRHLYTILMLALAAAPSACTRGLSEGGPAPRSPAEQTPPFAVAPEFQLPDGAGKPHRLADLMGPKGLVLVIYRGHW